jgi:hypothetical protein
MWLSYWAFRLARGQWRSAQRARQQNAGRGGKWSCAAVLFTVLPFTVLWMLASVPQHDPGRFWALAGVNTGLFALFALAAGWRVVSRQEPAPLRSSYSVSSPEALEERAAVLEALEAAAAKAEPSPAPEAVERARRVAALLSVACPPGPDGCGRPAGASCNGGEGASPVVIVQRGDPALFCHMCRMAAAIVTGAADYEEVKAQFGSGNP